jgi:acetyltransferase-like isoleucine patch superfamily enzyme
MGKVEAESSLDVSPQPRLWKVRSKLRTFGAMFLVDLGTLRTRFWLGVFNTIPDFYSLKLITNASLKFAGASMSIMDTYVRRPFYADAAHRVSFGRATFVNRHLTIEGFGSVSIGDGCKIGPECMFTTTNHVGDDLKGKNFSTVIGNRCWIGARTIIVPGVRIADGITIAAGSVVTRDIETGKLWGGVPARQIR